MVMMVGVTPISIYVSVYGQCMVMMGGVAPISVPLVSMYVCMSITHCHFSQTSCLDVLMICSAAVTILQSHDVFEGILPQKKFYRPNLIFWIEVGCGKARFGQKGQKNT